MAVISVAHTLGAPRALRHRASGNDPNSAACKRHDGRTSESGCKLQDNQNSIHAVAVRANMRSILVAMMKSFSCSPLIFLVCRDTVALPQPKLIFG
jgi:hypothetical protein